MAPRIPELPGKLVDDAGELKRRVAHLCRYDDRFPGSQPVSFAREDLDRLEREDYWVCEKSDGVRVLFYILSEGGGQDCFIINRHNEYRVQQGLYFPHHEDRTRPLGNTILDGELLIDTDPATGEEVVRLMLFDCLVVDNVNVMEKELTSRYGRLANHILPPYVTMLREHPHMKSTVPFDIQIKKMDLSYGVEVVLRDVIPKLQHGNDGLIFTCVGSGYVTGTDPRLLKWKAAEENSVDFKLELRFPPTRNRRDEVDTTAKPVFVLMQWLGGDKYDFFDTMHVSDESWEKMKLSREQVDDRIVEVCWNKPEQRWEMMRFRDDKPHGNHRSTIQNVLKTIVDDVKEEELKTRAATIRTEWKKRDAARAASQGQQPRVAPNPRPPQQAPQSHPPPQQQQQSRPKPPQPTQGNFAPPPPHSYASMVAKVTGPLTVRGFKR